MSVANRGAASTRSVAELELLNESGTLVGPRTIYQGSAYTKLVAVSTTLAAIDSTNLNVSLVAPPSGNVQVDAEIPSIGFVGTGSIIVSAALYLALVTHGTTTQVSEWILAYQMQAAGSTGNAYVAPLHRSLLTQGLTPGKSYEFDLAWAVASTSSVNADMFIESNHLTSGTPTGGVGSIILSPYAA